MTSWLLPSFRPRRTNPRFRVGQRSAPRGCFCQDIVQRQKSWHFATGERYRLAVGVLAKRRSISRSNTDRMFALLRHCIDPHRCRLQACPLERIRDGSRSAHLALQAQLISTNNWSSQSATMRQRGVSGPLPRSCLQIIRLAQLDRHRFCS
jgi:hypothetical protein